MSDCERAATWAASTELKLRTSEPWISVRRSMTETAGTLGSRKQSRLLYTSPSSRTPSYWCSSDAPPPPCLQTDAPSSSPFFGSEPQLNSVASSAEEPGVILPSLASSSCPSLPVGCPEIWFPSSSHSADPTDGPVPDGSDTGSQTSPWPDGITAAAKRRNSSMLVFSSQRSN